MTDAPLPRGPLLCVSGRSVSRLNLPLLSLLLCREVQYVVLQNIATMSIQRKVSLEARRRCVCGGGWVKIEGSYTLLPITTGHVRALHEEFLREVDGPHAHQNAEGESTFRFFCTQSCVETGDTLIPISWFCTACIFVTNERLLNQRLSHSSHFVSFMDRENT